MNIFNKVKDLEKQVTDLLAENKQLKENKVAVENTDNEPTEKIKVLISNNSTRFNKQLNIKK